MLKTVPTAKRTIFRDLFTDTADLFIKALPATDQKYCLSEYYLDLRQSDAFDALQY